VRARIGEQVADHLMQPRGVAGDDDGLLIEVEHPAVVRAGRAGIGDRLDRQPGEVDRPVHELLTLVEAGQQQEILHERGHPDRLRLDALERRFGRLDRARPR
jgi:hypothetical protein